MVHVCAHIAAFLVLTAVTLKPGWNTKKIIAACVALFLFGAMLEFLQTRVYHNRLEVSDMVDDLAGILLAAATMRILAAVALSRSIAERSPTH